MNNNNSNDEGVDMLLKRQNPPVRQRRQRTNFDENAIDYLDQAFMKNPYPDINEREQLALILKTTEDRIQVWFQNKRARYRKKMTKKSNSENETKKTKKTESLKSNQKLNDISNKQDISITSEESLLNTQSTPPRKNDQISYLSQDSAYQTYLSSTNTPTATAANTINYFHPLTFQPINHSSPYLTAATFIPTPMFAYYPTPLLHHPHYHQQQENVSPIINNESLFKLNRKTNSTVFKPYE